MSQTPDSQPKSERAATDTAGLVGRTLSDRYKLLRLLGEGAMGAVYLAEHILMHKRVAVKVLHAEMSRLPEVVGRFEREAVAAGHIEHPNVAAATDFGKLEDGSFFLVLEYVEGVSLRHRINRGALSFERSLNIVRQIASALGRAHQLGIVHRDLKPENVMLVDRDGDPDFVKVLDFGIARVPMGEIGREPKSGTAAITRAGMVYGTPEYMAPEQALGQEVDARADLYALGVMLYEMITGWRPFDADSKVQLLGMHVTAAIPKVQEKAPDTVVPAAVDALIGALMAKDMRDRPASAKDVVDAIDAMATGAPLALAGPPSGNFRGAGPGTRSAPSLPENLPSLSGLPTGYLAAPVVVQAKSLAGNVVAYVRRLPLAARVGVGALAVLLVGGMIAVALGPSKRPPATLADGGAVKASTEPLRADVAEAVKLFEKGEMDKGRAKLGDAKPEASDMPRVYEAMVKGFFATGQPVEAISELDHLAGLDPISADKPEYIENVRKAAISGAGAEASLRFLEQHPTARGCDVLYDLAWVAKVPRPVSDRAAKALRVADVREKASDAASVAIDLRFAGLTCEAKSSINVAAKVGDARAIPMLRALAPARMVKVQGHYKAQDLLACVHGDDSVVRAIASIEARAKAQPQAPSAP
jgi:serine/threonine-protein kinase